MVPLGAEVVAGHGQAPAPSGPTSRLHGLAITGLGVCALLGIGAMLAFVTVRWEGSTGRFFVALFILAAIGFLACASAAVFTAARDTYAQSPARDSEKPY
ncbi:MAG TPA: hypothetical protein VIG64_10735 [Actinomycetota bacterium]